MSEGNAAKPHRKSQGHSPARRVIYSSRRALIARLLVGVLLAGLTGWVVLPVFETEPPPPRPTGMFVGLNSSLGPGASNASVLRLSVRGRQCRNPVLVEGLLERSEKTWSAEAQSSVSHGPTYVRVSLSGARLTRAEIGLGTVFPRVYASSGPLPGGKPLPGATQDEVTHNVGVFNLPILSHTITVTEPNTNSMTGGTQRTTVHNYLSPILTKKDARPNEEPDVPGTANDAVLLSPDWPSVRGPLHFIIEANLVHSAGFNRCYLDLPELFATFGDEAEDNTTAIGEATRFDPLPSIPTESHNGIEEPESIFDNALGGEPYNNDIGQAEVSVKMTGDVVVDSTVGNGGIVTPNGITYECHTYNSNKPPPNLDPNMFEGEGPSNPTSYEDHLNANCAATPIFETPDVNADVTRRLFTAGIVGALAATLIIEALFLGETPDTPTRGLARRRLRPSR